MAPFSRNLVVFSVLSLFLIQIGAAQNLIDVNSWEVYRATTQPRFRMAFPGSVSHQESETGHTYSGDVRLAEDLALQVVVHSTRRSQSSSEMKPEEALAIFTSNSEGKVTTQGYERDGTGFILSYTTEETEDGLIVTSFHDVYFLGFNVYDVSCTVIAEQSVSPERMAEPLEKAKAGLERFQAG
jgi:hypothetical protein